MVVKPYRRPRLKELSLELGLSITTVSRALAGYSDVSEATRERVQKLAARSGYTPSRAGRSLVSGKSDFVSLFVPKCTPSSMLGSTYAGTLLGNFIMLLSEALTKIGRDLTVTSAPRNRYALDILRHVVDGQQIDGMVVANQVFTDDDQVSFMIDQQVPFVLYGRVLGEDRRHIWFDLDGEAAFAEATEMLIALGHQRFGLLTFSEPLTFAHFRRLGMEITLRKHGLQLATDTVVSVEQLDEQALARGCAHLLSLDPRPTAILCATDALAIRLIEIAAKNSINVPEDLSVIGFDNVPASAYVAPGLTTFDQRIQDSATIQAAMLSRLIDSGIDSVQPRLLKADLVARGSHTYAPTAP